MSAPRQPGNMRPENPRPFIDVKVPATPRLNLRAYPEVYFERLEELGWTQVDLAENLQRNYPEWGFTVEQVYEALERPRGMSAWFAKALEWTLGINLPPQCHYNAAKRPRQ